MRQIFISYKSEENKIMKEVLDKIEESGYSCWVAPRNIPIGSNYAAEIPSGIDSCSVFILLLSKKAQNSPWISKELSLAIGARKEILPIMIEECELTSEYKYYLTNIQIYRVYENGTDSLKEVLDRLSSLNVPRVFSHDSKEERRAKSNDSQVSDDDSRYVSSYGIKLYNGNAPYIFISYAHKDINRVLPIVRALSDEGCRVWMDLGICPGSEWAECIAERISKCHVFMPMLSEAYVKSNGCENELQFACWKIPENVQCVKLEDVSLPASMLLLIKDSYIEHYETEKNSNFVRLLSDLPETLMCFNN